MKSGNLPDELLREFNIGNVVLFIGDLLGEGHSLNATLTSALVEASEAYCDFCRETKRCKKPDKCVVSLAHAAQIYESLYNRRTLVNFARRHLCKNQQPTPIHRQIAKLPLRLIVTTAYDDRLYTALTQAGHAVSHITNDKQIPYDDPSRIQLIRLHGSVSQPETMVLTEDDTADLLQHLPIVTLILQAHFASKTLLFIGYDLGNPHFRSLYRQVTEPIADHARLAFAVQWPMDEMVARRWQGQIQVIQHQPLAFLSQLTKAIQPIVVKTRRRKLPSEPYKFLDFFDSKDDAIFYGRNHEAERLFSLILAHSLSVLYGESGTGKTSLIKAGVLPRLEYEGYYKVYARALSDPSQAIRHELVKMLPDGSIETRKSSIVSLRDLIRKRLPEGKHLVVVLDQFEEFFIRQGAETRTHFIKELVDLLNVSGVHCLLSLRSEYLDRLDELIPYLERDPLQHRMRLHNLGPAAASAAIAEPAAAFEIRLHSALLDQLLIDLEQEGIAPPQLQIVCYVLWQDWQTRGSPQEGLVLDRYLELGGTGAILNGYLDDAIMALNLHDTRQMLGLTLDGLVAQEAAQAVLKSMITAERTKVAISGREITHGEIISELEIPPSQTEALLLYFQDRRIIRRLPDSDLYELAHEVMIDKVWEWVSEEERHILDLQDMLVRATSDYRKFRSLLPLDRLKLLTEQASRLLPSEDSLELLLVSAIEHNTDSSVWCQKMASEKAVTVLADLLRTQKRIRYPQVAKALGYTRSSKAIRYLEQLLRDETNEVQRAAIEALVQINLPVVARPLYYVAQQETSLVRVAPIVDALEALRTEDAAGMLTLMASQHPNPHVRSRATSALLRLGYTQGTIPLIIQQFSSDDPLVRQNLLRFTTKVLEENPDGFVQVFNTVKAQVRENAIEVLRSVNNKRANHLLRAALQDENVRVRQAAAGALGQLGDERAVEPLLTALQDENIQVRRSVMKALGALWKLVPLEQLGSDVTSIRINAANALGQLGDERAVEPLLAALQGESAGVRQAAAVALGQLGDERAVEPLLTALQDESTGMRKAAAGALGQLEYRRAVEPLLTALRDEVTQVRWSVMKALGELWQLAPLEQLGSDSTNTRINAADALGQLEDGRAVEPLLAALQDESTGMRKAAAGALGQLGDGRAVEPLLAALQDESTGMRKAAAGALGQLGDGRAVEPLLAALQDESAGVRQAAAGALGQLGDGRAVEPLLTALQDESAGVRQAAAGALGQLRDERAVEPLLTALQDENVGVRRAAADTLGQLEYRRAVEPLLTALQDENAGVRRAAVIALEQLGDGRAAEPLLTVLQDESAGVRRAAAGALSQLRDERVMQLLLAALRDEDAGVRRAAADTLGQLEYRRAVEPLLAALQDESAGVRRAAAGALGQLGDGRAVEPLLAALQDENAGTRLVAAIALGQLGDGRAVEPLLTALQDENAGTRRIAAGALGRLGDGRAVEPLLTALQDKNAGVRKAAAGALGQLGDERAVEPLLAALLDNSANVRTAAVNALGQLQNVRTLEPILTLLKDNRAGVRVAVAKVLGKLGNMRAVESLETMLEDSHSSVRKAAAEALKLFRKKNSNEHFQ